ncbi:MAG: RNA 3'-terminal phosphate cyclase [Caldimicrobium sp.]|nr:RNA 3'-terminal phosphate cyclase [Caldimicrobium sp.]MCX7612651.1 RNA 3'-terminal phosphate cyclase [Caldimicrobium sp.]MDW8182196.1 RNA 3'-terminal phosphate cyclase [Caldimicrobium sp.]
MLTIDGSFGEGGGQLLRTALSLSIILKKPFHIINIRAGRPKPGLQPQHLTCVKACQRISNAITKGDEINSKELTFIPTGDPESDLYHFDIGTAGSTSLLFQTLLYPLALSQGGTLILEGGTHVPHSPTYHYLERVFLPVIQSFGFKASLELKKAGFYPKGGGKIKAQIFPVSSFSIPDISPGFKPEKIEILSTISEDLPRHIMERQAKSAVDILTDYQLQGDVQMEKINSNSPGTMLLIVSKDKIKRAGFSSLGKRGLPAEEVAKSATYRFLEFLERDAQFEEYLGDQLLLPVSLSLIKTKEKSFQYTISKITKHILTQAWLIPQFLEDIKISIIEVEKTKGRIIVERR